jgi:hypothetical protein
MRKLYLQTIVTLFLLINLTLLSSINVSACVCYVKEICEEYSEAKSVFIGKLEKLEDNSLNPRFNKTVYFSVEKTFKGKTEKIEQIDFLVGGDCAREFKVGEKYFVYEEESNRHNPCNRTGLLSELSSDVKYAEKLSETNPIFTIGGRVNNLSKEELKNSEVWIEREQKKIKLSISEYGNFEYVATESGLYHIKIILPFDAGIQMMSTSEGIIYSEGDGFKITNTKKQTIIEYDTKFTPNNCNLRKVNFDKDYKIILSKINGKIVDESDSPVSNIIIHLFPNRPNQNFTGFDYTIDKTNETGDYTIGGLKPGSYILGINMGKTPELELPYPETYFPGKKTLRESQVITLAEGQNINLQQFILPPKLKPVKIYGKTIWADGTPAAKSLKDTSSKVNPRIYLIDPITLKSFGGLIETDNQGNFSFSGFEGYSYILHADGINSKNQLLHAKHTILNASENTLPVTLNLNLNGDGRDVEDLKQEIKTLSNLK